MFRFTIFLVCFIIAEASIYTNKIYKWTKNLENYDTFGKDLVNNKYRSLYYKYTAVQCAYECLKDSKCKSFSHNKTMKSCNFHSATHVDYPASYVDDIEMDYHTRNAYSIDVEALGPCGIDPCNDHGKCLETKTSDDDLVAMCLCEPGWIGNECEIEELVPQWGDWNAWQSCSVTCGKGWKRRARNCEDVVQKISLPKHRCFGQLAEIEYQGCNMISCPSWEEWGSWGECSTRTSCGRGLKFRNRTCSNGGQAGVDRYCLGRSNMSTPCYDMSCKSGLRIKGGIKHGEGRVEIYNDLKKEWGLICTDQWNLDMADLICKQIGLPSANAAITDGRFGNGNGLYGISDINCNGGERTLQMCQRNLWSLSSTSCPGNKAAGIQCQVNGAWSLWGEWGVCSVTCEDGIRTRTRTCDHPPALYGGRDCKGVDLETKPCTLSQCPIDGVWNEWSDWSSCSVSCGNGTHYRTRLCDGPYHGGADCGTDSRQEEWCKDRECPIDGIWRSWGEWGECSHTCGGGNRERSRTCDGPFYDGANCPGSPDDVGSCNTFSCPVDGTWLNWQEWQQCNVTCGGGIQIRERICESPKFGGVGCFGAFVEPRECNKNNCPIDGIWMSWSDWGECTRTCGNGTQVRTRDCDGPYYGGKDCESPGSETMSCNTHQCPVDGIEGEWEEWKTCSVSCGDGVRMRQRSCIGPFYGGKDCMKSMNDSGPCNDRPCPVDAVWLSWGDWAFCDVSCGGGVQFRERLCDTPLHGGKTCSGDSTDSRSCNYHSCPVDGVWAEWGSWGECAATCGIGVQNRFRNCTGPFFSGKECVGLEKDSRSCNSRPCPVPGDWFQWTSWSPCTVSCNGGTHARSRVCDMTSYGNLTAPCNGDANEITDCHTFPCQPHARTCTEWGQLGLMENNMVDVDPDGEGGTLKSVRVYCDMISEGGIGVTVVGHDNEERTQVVGYEGAGEFKMTINYNVSLDHAMVIADVSSDCKQFLKWECKAALIHNPNSNGIITTGWVNRTGGIADYFSGALPGTESCACGMDRSCADPGLLCNCDMNDAIWREDSGYITYKQDLPVIEFLAGDTGEDNVEEGYVTVSRMTCRGIAAPEL